MVVTRIHPSVMSSLSLRFASLCVLLAIALGTPAQTSITPLDELAFGTVAAIDGGTVTIGANGSRSVEGLIDIAAAPGGGVATFEILGSPSTAYAISFVASITLHRSTGSETMTIDDFVTDPDGAGLLDGAGRQIVSVGATLHVAAAQRPGTYSGSFDITIDYQ